MADKRKALITGASEGIGRVFAQRLAAEGYDITAVARNETRLKELIHEMKTNGHSYQVADLSTQDGIDRIVTELKKAHYDLLINNAGYAIYSPFHQTDLAKLRSMTRVNCDALVALSHVFLNQAQSGDTLMNVASGLAFMPMPKASLYSATKAFVLAFSETLWFEHKNRGVNIIALCPGVTSTNFHHRAGGTEKDLPPEAITQTPEEVVEVGLKALKNRKGPTIVSGFITKSMTVMARMMTRKKLVSMMGRNG